MSNLHSARFLALQLLPSRLFPPKPLSFHSRGKLGFRFKGFCCTSGSRAMEAPLMVKERIELTETEEKIFRRLLDVVRHFQLDIQLRVAGGWVRDKLLGKDCCDIDIALDNMLGREFCEKVNAYLQYAGEEQQGIGVIQCPRTFLSSVGSYEGSNPDQSKHLETARMRIYDTWIDFVNLRSETYAENSRIPKMKFGTATEDAYRRDLTINSLFYNINTTSVEDLTGRGVQDLKAGYIVTPLPPKATFLDDPLRVLRAIRFGARFDFLLDEELKKAASDEEVRAAISDKISRERIGHEVDLMISGNQPVKAMTYICDLRLFFAVFSFPEHLQPSEGCDRLCISYMDAAWKVLQLVGYSIFSDEERRLYLYGALFFHLKSTDYIDKKSKKICVTNYIFRDSLKLKASDADMVKNLHAESERFDSMISFSETNEISKTVEDELQDLDIPPNSRERVLAGLILRKIKDYWRVALLLSCLLHHEVDCAADLLSLNLELERRDTFLRVEKRIAELGLDNVWEAKPLLDGKAIMDVLQLKKGGPEVKKWQDSVIKWQLAYRGGTAEECLDWMRQSRAKRAKLDPFAQVQNSEACLSSAAQSQGGNLE